ncbi:hypothetical protein G6O67_002331 [Ophiocordyceps sinensis]|uniref:Uncharacterized protein n=2 Tax=Ophiocordyceps sinensis TaxID=72228 RepID=A0A8H4PU11_9HYPO|nr:hypothetical protein OCS_03155 [Ophiocordyceps sinensis CO18]KAF4510444.1 hypothetical protein G6O67_002331 [Ophiocordyceps sinensis]
MASSASNKQQHQAEQPPRPASRSSSQFSSHGRGGAGNMADARQSPRVTPSDLETPVLKKPVVTTGRGGTGNMAKNDDPVETRMRQDVEGVPRRLSSGAQYAGRGGAGNVFWDGDEGGAELAHTTSQEQAVDDDGADPLPSKSRKWLLGKKT